VHVHRHVGQHELDGLKGRDGLAELLALLRVAQRSIEGRLGHPDRGGPGHRARVVARAHGDLEALALRAQVGEARMPIFRSFLPTLKPLNVGSTRKAVTPRAPFARSTVANSVMTPAFEPFEHQSLLPLRT
jgi:hypothetical protein